MKRFFYTQTYNKTISNARHPAPLDNPGFVIAALKDFLSMVTSQSREEKSDA